MLFSSPDTARLRQVGGAITQVQSDVVNFDDSEESLAWANRVIELLAPIEMQLPDHRRLGRRLLLLRSFADSDQTLSKTELTSLRESILTILSSMHLSLSEEFAERYPRILFWIKLLLAGVMILGASLLLVRRIKNEPPHILTQFQEASERLPIGILVVNSYAKIRYANQALLSAFGYAKQELIGQSLEVLIPIELRSSHAESVRQYLNSPTARSMGAGRDLFGQRRDGSLFPVEVGLQPLHTPEGLFVITSLTDISIRKALEQRAERHTQLFEKIIEIKKEFMVGVSFEVVIEHLLKTGLKLVGCEQGLISRNQSEANETRWLPLAHTLKEPEFLDYLSRVEPNLFDRDREVSATDLPPTVSDLDRENLSSDVSNQPLDSVREFVIDRAGSDGVHRETFAIFPLKNKGKLLGIFVVSIPYRVEAEFHALLSTCSVLLYANDLNHTRLQIESELRASRDDLYDRTTQLEMVQSVLEEQSKKLVSMAELLKAEKDMVVQASEAKSQFLANMSHEIRTPLTSIAGFAEILLQAGPEAERDEAVRCDALRTIFRNSQHLLGVINDILDLSKVEAGKISITERPTSPKVILEESISIVRGIAAAKGIEICTCLQDPPALFLCDPTRLRQILVNLITNAVKFTESGSVTITLRKSDSRTFEYDVTDTGIGIPADKIAELFNPFHQIDSSMTRKFGGTGLGLCIGKKIAKFLGGDLTLYSSQVGVGSTFRLRLPYKEVLSQLDLPIGSPTPELEVETGGLHPPLADALNKGVTGSAAAAEINARVLLVEDGADNQKLITYLLRKQGYHVDVSGNGLEGVQAVNESHQSGNPYDLVLMDMAMPVMDGYQATRELRSQGNTIPIIALTAHAANGDRERCLEAGCDDYSTKPINKENLIGLIQKYVSVRRLESQKS